MSVHDQSPAGKHSRLGLYIPLGLLLAAIAAWSGYWVWAKGAATARMDEAVARLGEAGYRIAWEDRTIGGYPFRFNVTLTGVAIREPAGWGLQSPRLEGEAKAFAPGSWIVAAPQGLTFVRPEGGPVRVSGKMIRASLTHLGRRPPNFSFEAVRPAFQPQPGARPFALNFAERVELHLRAGPDDEGGVFLKVEGGIPRPGSVLALAGDAQPVALSWNSTLSKMSAFDGPSWSEAVRNWTASGGAMTVRDAGITAGQARLGVKGGRVSAGSDGRAVGALDLTLSQTSNVLTAMGQAGLIPQETAEAAAVVARARQGPGGEMNAALTFQAGRTTLGPVAIAAAPKIYDVR